MPIYEPFSAASGTRPTERQPDKRVPGRRHAEGEVLVQGGDDQACEIGRQTREPTDGMVRPGHVLRPGPADGSPNHAAGGSSMHDGKSRCLHGVREPSRTSWGRAMASTMTPIAATVRVHTSTSAENPSWTIMTSPTAAPGSHHRACWRTRISSSSEEHEWGQRDEEEEQVPFSLPDHVGREAVQKTADESGECPGSEATKDEEGSRCRAGEGEGEEHVERGDRTEQQSDRCPDDARERHRGVVSEVDAPRIIDPVRSEGILEVGDGVRRPCQEPRLLAWVAVTAALHRVGHPPVHEGRFARTPGPGRWRWRRRPPAVPFRGAESPPDRGLGGADQADEVVARRTALASGRLRTSGSSNDEPEAPGRALPDDARLWPTSTEPTSITDPSLAQAAIHR